MTSKPTHELKFKSSDRSITDSRRVAAVWQNPEGHFTVRLDRGVVLHWRDMEDSILTIFPIRDYVADPAPAPARSKRPPYRVEDDDIPF